MTISVVKACNLIIFGAKGDLARRKLLPSLYKLEKSGFIHPDTRIIGVGRAKWDIVYYIETIRVALETFMDEVIDELLWYNFSARFDFCNLDVNKIEQFSCLLKTIKNFNSVTIHYFAMPPNTFGAICKGLNSIGLNKIPSRVVIEKPIGTNLTSACVINNQIKEYFLENQIYRIDHYLGKETVLNLLSLRFANSLFTLNWDHRVIDHVQITVAEDIGIEGRYRYFDSIGQMRDMIQSHLLQILTIIAMSPPSSLNVECIRDEKIKILKSLRFIDYKNVHNLTVRGQYTSGFIQGKKVPGYLEEVHAFNKNSSTETFVSIRVDIDNWRWAGVPFYLRTGKRLPTKYSEVVIYFKEPTYNLFVNTCKNLPNNKLIIRLQPNEGIDLQILNRVPNLCFKHKLYCAKLQLDFNNTVYDKNLVDAYERLLLEIMQGIQTLFVCYDEVESSWKWVDSVLKAWEVENIFPFPYQAGSWGPLSSISLIDQDGRSWNDYMSK